MFHHRHSDPAAVEQVEGPVRGQVLFEGSGPSDIEVDGVGEHKLGQLINNTLRNQVFYPVFRLVADPAVDSDTGCFRVAREIEKPQASTVVLIQGVEEFGEESAPLLAPDGVNDVQPEALSVLALGPLTPLGEFQIQAVEGGMQTVLGKSEMESLCHLLFGLAASAGVGHRQGQRDAVRGVEEIAVLFFPEKAVEVEGERAVPPTHLKLVHKSLLQLIKALAPI